MGLFFKLKPVINPSNRENRSKIRSVVTLVTKKIGHRHTTNFNLRLQELYKKFRGILNKLTPQKFNTLIDKVKGLKIDTQKRLEGVIDLVFEKAIEEPNFSEAYAVMCSKLSTLKVSSFTIQY